MKNSPGNVVRNQTASALKEEGAAAVAPWFLRKGYPLLWMAIFGFLIFGRTIGFDYTFLDDQTLVLNQMEQLKDPSYIRTAFSGDVFHAGNQSGYYYRPMLTLTFMADAMAGGGSFKMFHFSNIVYHILATFMLFLFFYRTGHSVRWAFFCSMIFLVHPMITQVVAWVPGRNDSLLAILVLSAFLAWLKFTREGRLIWLAVHLLLFTMAMFTKENAVAVPILIILYTFLILKDTPRKLLIPAAGWVLIIFIWAIIRSGMLSGESPLSFSEQVLSVLQNLPAILPFLGKILFPFNLSVFPILADMKIPSMQGALALGLLLIMVILTRKKQWGWYIFAIVWFLSFLVPTFISVNYQISNFSEHRAYLSVAAVILFFLHVAPVKNTALSGLKTLVPSAAIIALFAILTVMHSRHFRDNFAFWQSAVDSSPSHAFNYNNLGAMYYLANDLPNAEKYFRKAMDINPYEPMANSNTGLVCMNTNRPAEAERYYLEEIRINPLFDHVYYNIGLLYYRSGRIPEAIVQWEKNLEVNPNYTEAYRALFHLYRETGQTEKFAGLEARARKNNIRLQ